jgi:hypothetical protein
MLCTSPFRMLPPIYRRPHDHDVRSAFLIGTPKSEHAVSSTQTYVRDVSLVAETSCDDSYPEWAYVRVKWAGSMA